MNLMFEKQIKLFENTELRYSMPDQWELSKLKRIARFQYGESLSELNRKEGEICVYGSNGIVGYHNLSLSKGPTIVVGRKGSAGAVNYSQSECFPIDTTFFIDQKSTKCDLRWLYYALLWLELHNMNSDSAVPGLNRKQAYQRLLLKPPYPDQRIIAAYLDKTFTIIDAAIDIKRKQLDTLEALRKSIIHKAVTRGLDDSVALKDSGVEWLGKIPAHWHVKRVKDITQIIRGKFTHRPRNDPRFYGGPYPFIQTGNVSSAKKYIREYHQTLNEEGLHISKKFPKGTLVMTIAANVGDVAILDFEACFPDSIVGFYPSHKTEINYLFYLFLGMRQALFSTAIVTTQLNLNIVRIGSLFTALPPLDEQIKIVEYLDKESIEIEKLKNNISTQISTLENYRKSLIHECVTGKRRVTEDDLAPV